MLEAKELNGKVWEFIDGLRPREAEIIKWRFGLEGDVLTLKECAKRLDRSVERVRQIEFRARRKIKRGLIKARVISLKPDPPPPPPEPAPEPPPAASEPRLSYAEGGRVSLAEAIEWEKANLPRERWIHSW